MEGRSLDLVIRKVEESIAVKRKILQSNDLLETIIKVADEIVHAFRNGGKLLICGNGGSAADAQHIAAEFKGKFYKVRSPLHAEVLGANFSYITAVSNDFSYEYVFAREVEAKAQRGDVLMAISTSGNSINVIYAVRVANDKGVLTVGMTGEDGGQLAALCRYAIKVPSKDTPRIQEAHILIGHIICELVEGELFGL